MKAVIWDIFYILTHTLMTTLCFCWTHKANCQIKWAKVTVQINCLPFSICLLFKFCMVFQHTTIQKQRETQKNNRIKGRRKEKRKKRKQSSWTMLLSVTAILSYQPQVFNILKQFIFLQWTLIILPGKKLCSILLHVVFSLQHIYTDLLIWSTLELCCLETSKHSYYHHQ